ncbi:MAG: hypothetical protein MJ240_04525 [Kiritimatiellae bacterium]|nr:hypothetical protein [Kiritimatiellia bacterium]
MMKFKQLVVLAFCVVGVSSGFSATYNVDNVTDLTNTLTRLNLEGSTGNTVVLAPGTYDLTGCVMQGYDANGKKYENYYGNLTITRLTLKGGTDNPRDTVLCGDGTRRVIYCWQGKLQHLTVSNGCETAANAGGVFCMNSVTECTNVVVTCCKGATGGAAYSGVWRNCSFIGNESTGSGGACLNCRVWGGEISGNRAASNGGGGYRFSAYAGTVISNNVAAYGGGVSNDKSGYILSNVVVVANMATSQGGGIYNSTGICVRVERNEAPYGGGIFGSTAGSYFWDSVVVGNVATNGGGCYRGELYDSVVVSNTAYTTGGGGYSLSASNSLIACNVAATTGGGYSGTFTDCVISNNHAQQTGGGLYGSTVLRSRVVFNWLQNDNTASGARTYGGGMNGGVAVDSQILGNAILPGANTYRQGAGAYGTVFTNCLIANNFVYSGAGAAMNSGSAYGCVISNNVSSSGSECLRQIKSEGLVACDIYEGGLDIQSWMRDCRVMNFTNGNVIAEGDNVYTSGHFKATGYLTENLIVATNCLFVNCSPQGSLFRVKTSAQCEFVNCTVADCRAGYVFNDATNLVANQTKVINCLFTRNYNYAGTSRIDFSFETGKNGLLLSNCLMGSSRTHLTAVQETNIITNDVAGFDPKSVAHPYSLSYSSPARGKGLVQDWMADAHDIRRDDRYARLREGKVDIGCYQCWLEPAGTLLLLR